jgi:hypothetical protein
MNMSVSFKVLKSIASLICVGLVTTIGISCSDEDEPAANKVVFFELGIDETFHTTASDDWVIIHDEEGKLYGVQSFESGDQIAFDSTSVPDKIGVTLVHVETLNGNFTVKTYLNQEPMSSWKLKTEIPPSDQGSYVGLLDVKVSDPNLGSTYDSEISSKYTDGLSSKSGGADIVFSQRVATTEKKHLVFVTDKDGNPFYKFLAPGLTGSITYSLQDFTAYEKTAAFKFPSSAQYFIDVRAFEASDTPVPYHGYHGNIYWDGYFTGAAKNSVKLGFTEQLPIYRIDAAIVYANYSLGFNYFGPAPTSDIELTNNIAATVTGKTFAGHAISGSDFSWYRSFWQVTSASNPVGFVTVHGSNEAFINLQAIPPKITSKYPQVNPANFTYTGSYLYKGTQSYETFIAEEFEEAERSSFELRFKNVY